jgi:hypothetical protein
VVEGGNVLDTRRVAHAVASTVLLVLLGACGGEAEGGAQRPPVPIIAGGYTVSLRSGVADVGSGVVHLTLLATIRDAAGEGPADSWDANLYDSDGGLEVGRGIYDAPGAGSYVAWSWPEVPVRHSTSFSLRLGPAGQPAADIPFDVAATPSVGLPVVRLSLDGERVEWDAVAGAAAYRCTAWGLGGGLESVGTETSCDLSSLPAGGYAVSIAALSVDLDALAASTSTEPTLPPRFDVGVGRLGVYRPFPGEIPLAVRAAGGALRVGTDAYLALWASVITADGKPIAYPVYFEVSRWNGANWAPFGWGYDQYEGDAPSALHFGSMMPLAGEYLLTMYAGGIVSVPFSVGAPAELAPPASVVVESAASGSVSVAWTPVSGARSYLVRAYDPTTGSVVVENWTQAPPVALSPGSFTSGRSYDVYVLATDADMLGGAVPTQVGAGETVTPVTFTAP